MGWEWLPKAVGSVGAGPTPPAREGGTPRPLPGVNLTFPGSPTAPLSPGPPATRPRGASLEFGVCVWFPARADAGRSPRAPVRRVLGAGEPGGPGSPGRGAQPLARGSSRACASHPTGPRGHLHVLLLLVPACGPRTGQPGESHVARSPASPGRALGPRRRWVGRAGVRGGGKGAAGWGLGRRPEKWEGTGWGVVSEEEPGRTVLFHPRRPERTAPAGEGARGARLPGSPAPAAGPRGGPSLPARGDAPARPSGLRGGPAQVGRGEGRRRARWGRDSGCGRERGPRLTAAAPRAPSPGPWPRDAAAGSRGADAGAPLPSGAHLVVSRPAGRMGGGGSALRVCADHRGGINWLSLSPDGQRLLTGSEDGTARLWSTADGQCCALLQGHESYVTFCQLEDEAAFTCSADCTIRKWDVRTGQCLQVFRGHTSIVNRILVANNQLFSSSYDRTARAWSVDKGQVSQEFRGHRNCVLTLAYSAPWDLPGAPCAEEVGGLLVTGSTDGTAKVWQVASGCCHQTLRGHTGAVLCLVLDTPSHTAFTGSTDATIRAWDILSGEQLRVFREHQGSVICLELVNRHVYSGSADRTVKCWLADTGERVRTFAAHRHSVSALKYHAGTLFTGSGDARARAFDAQSGALQRVFRGHAFVINCIQVHEQVLYTASHDGALRLWDVRGLPCAPPPRPAAPARSRSRLFSNKVGCAAAPLQPA
uniref:WD repeat domain 86 n=2 Tax=Canis lupus familiaris TaxID=9615 RepID=A0A8C0QMA0_CANLF